MSLSLLTNADVKLRCVAAVVVSRCDSKADSASDVSRRRVRPVTTGLPMLALVSLMLTGCEQRESTPQPQESRVPRMDQGGQLSIWWDAIPDYVHLRGSPGTTSNIHRADYSGPESCKNCHLKNYQSWSEHPHRWMNSLVEHANVVGDFGERTMDYLGGRATFLVVDGRYVMRLQRDGTTRDFEVTQTIGSRFFQYYVGRQTAGPEPPASPQRTADHVLPFGFWIEEQEWVPIVHVGDELPDGERLDPFDAESLAQHHNAYARQCSTCHTTLPLGDRMIRSTRTIGRHAPRQMHLFTSEYLAKAHPDLWDGGRSPWDVEDLEMLALMQRMTEREARDHAVTLGVSCEACHLGARAHAEGNLKKPVFFPHAPELYVIGETEMGRTRENINWACGRCHTGNRPQFANGIATWNSTEFDDMMRGGCVSQISCVDCHEPHTGIGSQWTRTPDQDDQSCLKCHSKFNAPDTRLAHTHHPPGSSGDRCMNCHMPRLNEGLQDVVRTHMIFSPTDSRMIEAGHPNACNLCHTDQTIQWTVDSIDDWYGAELDRDAISRAYPDTERPASLHWMKNDHESVRLVAADALCRTKAHFALDALVNALDDPYLLNRQFAQRGLERMMQVDLDEYGYRFYMTPVERQAPVDRVRQSLVPGPPTENDGSRDPD